MPKPDPHASAGRPPDPAVVFAALGDPTRLSLLMRLADGRARSIAALSAGVPLTRQAVTKHLHVLEEAGLVASSRTGRESRYAGRPETLAEARAYLDMVSARWDEALGRLKALAEG
jgi:DNA-binding transcriptional ArsR family regulator